MTPMEAARMQWWKELSGHGDPACIVNPLSVGFLAGWESAGSVNAELLEALKELMSAFGGVQTHAQQVKWDKAKAAIAKAEVQP